MKPGVEIVRDENGVPHIKADSVEDMFWGQGYVHARDRGMQILLMRILGQGRASELLDSSDETLKIDLFFRKMNWSGTMEESQKGMTPTTWQYLQAYSKGITAGLEKSMPWEMKLMGVSPEPWTPEHCIMISRMVGYLTLVQSQAEIERFIVEMVQAGVPAPYLEELFPGLLKGLDVELLKKVKLGEKLVNPSQLWNLAIPRMSASNNWVISGKRTRSGKPIVANDPHLEINRLPNIWCEQVMSCGEKYAMGGTMPGLPGVLTGRTRDLAWGVTYAFVDTVDSWIEQCRNGACYREESNTWVLFKEREEVIKRKKKPDHVHVFFENEHGILDGDPNQEGYYLATSWTGSNSGPRSFDSFLGLWNVKTADEAMTLMGQIETGWSFVIGDDQGNIGFQMSGKVPDRKPGISGLVPLPGWKKENDWDGYIKPEDLPRKMNPEDGIFVTANHDLNEFGNKKPINMAMAPYRAERIRQLLKDRTNLSPEEMGEMHTDVYSIQAERFMEILKPLLPKTEQGQILGSWDFKYDLNSKGAYLFEAFYSELYRVVFGRQGMGEDLIQYLASETGIFVDFFDCFDRILLSEESLWFKGKTRNALFRDAASRALDIEVEEWGEGRDFILRHLLFGGKLPKFFGFDRGPLKGLGGRATIHQGQIYRSAGRDTTFMPSIRLIIDLDQKGLLSNLVGGPSDRRFSKWYVSDLNNWIKGVYKSVEPDSPGPQKSFP